MCVACVAQGSLYLGGAVGALRVMAARAQAARGRDGQPAAPSVQYQGVTSSSGIDADTSTPARPGLPSG